MAVVEWGQDAPFKINPDGVAYYAIPSKRREKPLQSPIGVGGWRRMGKPINVDGTVCGRCHRALLIVQGRVPPHDAGGRLCPGSNALIRMDALEVER